MAVPTNLQRLARRALLTLAKADTPLTTLVPAASIAPDGTPVWPFMLIESPAGTPLLAAGVRGANVSFDVHAFAGPRKSGSSVLETGYDHASRIGAAIEGVFADNRIALEDGSTCRIEFSDMRMLKDGAPDDWHWFGQLNARVLAVPA